MATRLLSKRLVVFPGRRALVLALTLFAAWHWGQVAMIELKASAAQVLIAKAWAQKLNAPSQPARPWPWADTQPVGRLQWLNAVGEIQRDFYVLEGAHGSALAFGPGLVQGTGSSGALVIGGHRDTHFAFLRDAKSNDLLRWQSPSGEWTLYKIRQSAIADSSKESLWIDPTAQALWLVTCYPFDAITAGGSLRFVVHAEPATNQLAELHAPKTRLMF